MNYEKLMAHNPCVYTTFVNSKKQEIELVEHPLKGDEYPVIAVCHKLKKAVTTDFWDTEDITAEHGEYEIVFDDTTYVRKCSVSGRGMNKGYVVNEGNKYISSEKDALKWCRDNGYPSLDEAYKKEVIYYTEWEDLEEEINKQGYYYTADGVEIQVED